jgi:phosphotransferase system  glucose/maltose/N-acetylglucosamine-specific IIC component
MDIIQISHETIVKWLLVLTLLIINNNLFFYHFFIKNLHTLIYIPIFYFLFKFKNMSELHC